MFWQWDSANICAERSSEGGLKAYSGTGKCSGSSAGTGFSIDIGGPVFLTLDGSAGVLVLSFVDVEGFFLSPESSLRDRRIASPRCVCTQCGRAFLLWRMELGLSSPPTQGRHDQYWGCQCLHRWFWCLLHLPFPLEPGVWRLVIRALS